MPEPAVVKANSYLSRLIDVDAPANGTSPLYLAVQPEIIKLSRIWMILPGNGNPLANDNPEAALADLLAFKTIESLDEIVQAASAVTSTFNAYFGANIKAFAQSVGEDTITANKPTEIFETRRAAEIAEQNGLFTSAKDFQTRVVQTAGKLSIALTATPPIPAKPAKTEGKNVFSFFMVPVDDASAKKSVKRAQLYDWQTAPIFDAASEDAQLFERIYSFLFVKNIDPAVVLQSLETSYGVSGDEVKALLGRLYDLTNRQIEQSQKILTFIETDYKKYQDSLMAGLELQAMIVDIGTFFNFTVGRNSNQRKTPSK